jgi:predicted DNA-binding protein (UPF0251 family)
LSELFVVEFLESVQLLLNRLNNVRLLFAASHQQQEAASKVSSS